MCVRTLTLVFVAAVLAVSTRSFQTPHPMTRIRQHDSSLHGLFDGFIKSMEGGYAGGDDSPYAKAKAADEAKLLERKKKAEARKKRGFTELKDAKKRTFAETKYDYDELPEKEDPFKKFFGKGFGTFNK